MLATFASACCSCACIRPIVVTSDSLRYLIFSAWSGGRTTHQVSTCRPNRSAIGQLPAVRILMRTLHLSSDRSNVQFIRVKSPDDVSDDLYPIFAIGENHDSDSLRRNEHDQSFHSPIRDDLI